tara:strand:- start:14545 stop:16077 length:1533 start_codon:yes stop_codon:yes gene_type:complete
MLGFNPIDLDEMEVQEWLNKTIDNIVIYHQQWFKHPKAGQQFTPYLLKRTWFREHTGDKKLYLRKCYYEGKQLLLKQTGISARFFDIGYFVGTPLITSVSNGSFRAMNGKDQEFIIYTPSPDGGGLRVGLPCIREDALLNAVVALKANKGTDTLENFPWAKNDIYFNAQFADALYKYSFQWDTAVNKYLYEGESYFKSSGFDIYKNRFVSLENSGTSDPVENIKILAKRLDEGIAQYADRASLGNIVYRGMKTNYSGLEKVGDKIIVKNYISTSTDANKARSFASRWEYGDDPSTKLNRCCMYYITLDVGVPYVDMRSTSKYKSEKEYLLPRGLEMKLTRINETKSGADRSHKTFHVEMRLPKNYPDELLGIKEQMKVCKKYDQVHFKKLSSAPKSVKQAFENQLQKTPESSVQPSLKSKSNTNNLKYIKEIDKVFEDHLNLMEKSKTQADYPMYLSMCIEKLETITEEVDKVKTPKPKGVKLAGAKDLEKLEKCQNDLAIAKKRLQTLK